MKNKFILPLWIMALLMLLACDEDVEKATLNDAIPANTLQPLEASAYTLVFEEGADDFEAFTWTVPDYGFVASANYTVEIDKAGWGFANAFVLEAANATSATLTVGELNDALLGLGLEPGEAAPVEVRVRATIGTRLEPVYSTVLSLTITPYATTFPPVYIVGDAQAWTLGDAVEMPSIAPGTYQAVAMFQNNGKFRLFETLSWTATQWGWSYFSGGTIASELTNAGDGDSNFLFNGATGYYKITVSLKDKTIAVEASAAPTLYLVGDAQAWDLGAALEMQTLGNGQFEVVGQFQQNGKFRFFVSPDWGADQYRYSFFSSGTIDADDLGDGADGDSNFLFKSASGVYKVVVNINSKTVTVEPEDEPALYIIGDDQGWSLGNAFKLTWLGGGKYEGTGTFTNGAKFRFFDRPDWSADFGDYTYFADGTISNLVENAADTDANFRFTGTTGTYTINVDLYNQVIELAP
jgi:hypothetical protein